MKTSWIRWLAGMAVALLALSGLTAGAESYSASTIRLTRYEGEIEILDAAGKPRFVMENARFASGESLHTGAGSLASVSLDQDRILTVDENSRVAFDQQGGALRLTLSEGALLLDVRDKLGEDETLDVETSTMTVGIRGTVVLLRTDPAPDDGQRTSLCLLEGKARVRYTDAGGGPASLEVEQGQKVVLQDVGADGLADAAPEIGPVGVADLAGLVERQMQEDPQLRDRVLPAVEDLFAADGAWSWNGRVTFIAQSASKLYDGKPLVRPDEVLVYGLPAGFSASVSASGSQTSAGESANPINGYTIYNSRGENVTAHFENIETVEGRLVVDRAPLTIWTGSAEKVYDGLPLTCEDAGARGVPGYEKDQPTWRNTSYVSADAGGGEAMYSLSGAVWVHGTNPLTGETRETVLQTGQRLQVYLSAADGEQSIEFRVENMAETDIPPELLRIYADNPELLAEACAQTGWDAGTILGLAAGLPETEDRAEEQYGLKISASAAGGLMQDCADVRIHIDTGITDYNGKALSREEAHFTGVYVDDSIVVTATGEQTAAGESENTYTIDWGSADPNNYIVSTDLGTLTVLPAALTVSTGSAEKEYDGAPLTDGRWTAEGLAGDETIGVNVTGSQTAVGTSDNTFTVSWLTADAANYTLIRRPGALKVTGNPAAVVFTAASAEKVYDGQPLTAETVTAAGVPAGFEWTASASGALTEAGTAENTVAACAILKDGTDVTAGFANVTTVSGTLTVRPLELSVNLGGAPTVYSGSLVVPAATLTYKNGSHAGETVAGAKVNVSNALGRNADLKAVVYDFELFTGDTVRLTITGSEAGVGTYTLKGALSYPGGRTGSFDAGFEGTVLTVEPRALTITTGSAAKAYDGTPLSCPEAAAEGLAEGDEVTVTATGALTDVGTAVNTYTIDWDDVDPENYTVTESLGALEVTPCETPVVITAASAERAYNGEPLTDAGFAVTGLPAGFACEATVSGSQTGVGSGTNTVTAYTLRDAAMKDVTAYFADVTTADGVLTVSPKPVTVTTGSAVKAYDGTALTKAEASITGLVPDETATVTATGTITDVGTAVNTYSIDWGTTDPANYTITETLGTLEVTANPAAITITAASAGKTYDGTALTDNGFTVDGLPTGLTCTATVSGSQTDAGTGDNVVTAYQILDATEADVTANFTNITTAKGTLTVSPKAATVTTGSASKEYDGTPLTSAEASITGLVTGETATVTATGTITDVGTADNTYDIAWDTAKAGNYTLTPELGTLTVTANTTPITITAATASKTYDGTALTDAGFTVTGTVPAGITVTAAVSGSRTDAGSSDNVVTSYSLLKGSTDVTSWFTGVTTAKGTLTVTPKSVTVTTSSATKPYDGTPLTSAEAAIIGLVTGETATVTATGTITDVGTAANSYTIDWSTATAKEGNYTLTEDLGTLKVTTNDTPIVITAPSHTWEYDGQELSVMGGSTVTGLPTGLDIYMTAGGSRKDVGTSSTSVSYYIMDPNLGIDVTSYFTNITTVSGTLTVNPKPVTVTTGSASKAYDGTALTKAEASITGLVPDETATVTATGTITDVGTADNTYSIAWGTAKAANYTITEFLGTLEVTASTSPITITAASAGKTYDGTALTDGGFTVDGLPTGLTCTATVSGSQTDAGTGDNVVTAYQILDATEADVTASFTDITTVKGTLTVTPKAATVTTGSASKEYDGTALTKAEASITGLVTGETATVTATGTITDVGSAANGYTIDWSTATAKEDNYTITEALGILTVTANTTPITITAGSTTAEYNAYAWVNHEYTVEGLPAGFTAEATTSGEQLLPGTSANTIASYTIYNAAHEERTESFSNVSLVAGTLTVTKGPVTVWVTGSTKTYDGKQLNSYKLNWKGIKNADNPATGLGATMTSGWITDAGTAEVMVEAYLRSDLTEKYEIVSVTPGTNKVEPAVLTVWTDSASKAYDGSALTAAVHVEGLQNGETVTAVGASITNAGSITNSYELTWDGTAKAGNYTVTDGSLGTLTVTQNTNEIILKAGSAEKVYDGTALTDGSFTVEGGELPGDTEIKVTVTGSQTDAGSSENTITEYRFLMGGEDITANYSNVTLKPGTLTVTPKAATVTTGSASKEYDGTPLTKDEASITGLVTGETATVTATGTITDVGTADNTYDIAWDTAKAGNYTLTPELGTLTVTASTTPITITAATASKTYDGTALTDAGFTVTGTVPAGITVTAAVSGSRTDAGSSDNVVTSYSLLKGSTDVTSWFTGVTTAKGTLTVKPKAATVTTGSASKAYDGTALTKDEASITGLVTGETATVTATGTITDVGTAPNTYTIAWGTAKEANYTITETLGTLEVTANPAAITITAATASKVYDGTALTDGGVTVTGLPAGLTVTATVSGSQTAAGSSDNTVTAYIIKNAADADVTANFTGVSTAKGTLTVEPLRVTVTLADRTSVYHGDFYTLRAEAKYANGPHAGEAVTKDGEADSLGYYTADFSLATGDGLQVKEVGEGPDAKTYTVTASASLTSGSAANYAITVTPGTLTIAPKPVTVTTGSASKAYDGTALTKAEASITGLVPDETATVTATGTITDVGTADNTYSIDWGITDPGNYTVTEALGTLTVTANTSPVHLYAHGGSRAYDGTALTNDECTWEGLPAGFTVTATVSGSQTDAGSSANKITAYTIRKGAQDVTAYFANVILSDAVLTVSPKPVTVTTGSASKAYDGTPLTKAEAAITGLAAGETATVTATGTITELGTAVNTYTVAWGTAKAGNYTITESLGTLEIMVNATPITITSGSTTGEYNAITWVNHEFTAEGLPAGFSADATMSGEQLLPGSSKNTISGYTIYNPDGQDRTACFSAVTLVPGTLTVTKGQVSVWVTGSTKTYDGAPLNSYSLHWTGIRNADNPATGVSAAMTSGWITDAGSVPVTVDASLRWDLVEKYEIASVTPGTNTVEPATLTVTSESASKVYDGAPLTAAVHVEGLQNGETVTAVGASITDAGSVTNSVTLTWDGTAKESNYTVTTDSLGTLTVTQNTNEIILTAGSAEKVYNGTALTDGSFTVEGGELPGDTEIKVTVTGSQTDAGSSENTITGYRFLMGGEDITANYSNVTLKPGTLTVTPKAATVTTGSASKEYDGTPLTSAEASITGLVTGETATVTATGSITDVGTATNGYTIDWSTATAKEDNYTITEALGTLTVTANTTPITITAATASKTYDGTALTDAGFTVTGTVPAGITVTAAVSGSRTDAGSSDNVVTSYSLLKGSTDVTSWFTGVTTAKGTLTVKPKAATVTTGSASKAYDGTALTKAEASITGLVTGETATVTATGTITDVGTAANSYTIDWSTATAKEGNYTLTEDLGTLKVTTNDTPIVITAPSHTWEYDGQELSVMGGSTVTGLPTGLDIYMTAGGSRKDVGTSPTSVSYYIMDPNLGIDVTSYFTNITTVSGTLTVNPKPVTVTTGSASKAYDGTALTKAEASITGLVEGETATASVTGSITHVGEAPNTCEIVWGTAKAGNYEVTKVLGVLTVSKRSATVRTGSDSQTYNGAPITCTDAPRSGFVSGEEPDVNITGSQTDAGSSENTFTIGSGWEAAHGGDYDITEEPGTLTVTPKSVTVTTSSATKPYDGTPLTSAEAAIIDLVTGETATVTATGTITDVGTADNTYDIAWGTAKAGNYTLTPELGTLTVTANTTPITITAATASKTYDGTALTATGFTVTGTVPAGITITATVSGSQTDAGSSDNVVTSYTILNGSKDVTSWFTGVTTAKGTLTVNPKAATVKTGSASKAYDGTALTKDEASITGLVTGETATVTATGSITDVGTADNTYSIDWGTTDPANYTITETLGTLEVTTNPAAITITAATASKVYDGTALTDGGVTVTGLPAGLTVTATVSGSQTGVGSSANTVTAYTLRKGGVNVTANFTNITVAEGTLTVTKAPLTIETGGATKVYDGTPLTQSAFTVSGLVSGETVTVTPNGAITKAGQAPNTYTITWSGANPNNYQVTELLGVLTVTKAPLTIETGSAEQTYNGAPIENTTAPVFGLASDEYVSVYPNGSQTDAGTSKNTYTLSWDGADPNDYYISSETLGDLTVHPRPLTVTTSSKTKPYDGTPLTSAEAAIIGLVEDETVTVTATGTITDAGTAENGYTLSWGTAKPGNYTVTASLGTLTVSPRPVTVHTGSKTGFYDGTPLTCAEASITGLVEGETATVTATGSITEPGTAVNTYTLTWGTAKPGNYTVTEDLGTLTIMTLARHGVMRAVHPGGCGASASMRPRRSAALK